MFFLIVKNYQLIIITNFNIYLNFKKNNMKKISITLIALIAILFASCSKSDSTATTPTDNGGLVVEKKNKALLLEFSETWCPPCGSYGVPAFDTCLSLEGNTISMMKVCASSTPSTFNAAVSSAVSIDLGVKGVPTFFVNSTELFAGGGLYSGVADNRNFVVTTANNFAKMPVTAGVAMSKTISNGLMTVKAKVQFFTTQTVVKDYRLSIFVLEDKLIADQATTTGTIPNLLHRNVLRICSNPSDYKGTQIYPSAAITEGYVVEKSFDIKLQSTWKTENLKLIGVIYDCTNASKPIVVNSNMLLN